MGYTIQKNVPLPTGAASSQETSDQYNAIMQMTEEGDFFFMPCPDLTERRRMQRNVGVRGAQMRERGTIDFYLTTRQMEGDDPETGKRVMGVGVWRRAAPPADVRVETE